MLPTSVCRGQCPQPWTGRGLHPHSHLVCPLSHSTHTPLTPHTPLTLRTGPGRAPQPDRGPVLSGRSRTSTAPPRLRCALFPAHATCTAQPAATPVPQPASPITHTPARAPPPSQPPSGSQPPTPLALPPCTAHQCPLLGLSVQSERSSLRQESGLQLPDGYQPCNWGNYRPDAGSIPAECVELPV